MKTIPGNDHGRTHFYKYLTPEGIVGVLGTGKTRWSSPRVFNDPYEVASRIRLTYTAEQLAEAFNDSVERIVYGSEEPDGDASSPFFTVLMAWRADRDRIPRSELMPEMRRVALEHAPSTMAKFRKALEAFEDELRTMHIFCVSEKNDDIKMWSHYAQSHSGAVLELRCVPEVSSALCAAMKVTYLDDPPALFLDPMVRMLTGQARGHSELPGWKELLLAKARMWEHEQEWRVFRKRPHEAHQDFIENPLLDEEIRAIYLGCRSARSMLTLCAA